MYIVYIRERYYFSLVCTFKNAIKNSEVKIDVQKGASRIRENIDNRWTTFIALA